MSDNKDPRITRAHIIHAARAAQIGLNLLAIAGGIVYQSPWPLTPALAALCVASAAIGAWLIVIPFMLRYRAQVQIADAESFGAAVTQMQDLRKIQEAITGATALWHNVQSECARTAGTAKEVADGMAREANTFMEFMQKSNDSEKAALRVDVDKRQRMELEWLQVTVRILDHVFALHQAALKSGQPALIENLTQFQLACRDAVRRVGLAPFEPQPGEPFNPEAHQLPDGAAPTGDAKIGQTLAPGFTWQSRVVRPALVALSEAAEVNSEPAAAPELSASPEASVNVTEVPVPPQTPSTQPTLL